MTAQSMTLPFSGIRVVDLTHVLAGPFASMILGDLGADVWKIEKPGRGDTTRGTPPLVNGVSHYFLAVNRNKRSVAVDLKDPRGASVIQSLADRADVFVHNFRPGVLDRYGLGAEVLRERNPGLVYCSLTGFGVDSKLKDRAAFDVIIQSMAGIMSVTGEPGGRPVRAGVSIGDLVSGLYAAQAIGAALYRRHVDGIGATLDVGMFDSLFTMLAYYITLVQTTGVDPGPQGSGHPSMVPGGTFATADGYVTIAAFNQGFWIRFCSAIGRENLADDARFSTATKRRDNRKELEAIIGSILQTLSTDEISDALERLDVPFGPMWGVSKAMASHHVEERGLLWEVGHRLAPEVRAAGYPVLGFPGAATRLPPPDLGEHSRAVLMGVLGMSEDEVGELVRAGVVGIGASSTP